MNKIDVMIDLETLGLTPGCVILAIGALPFNQYHELGYYTKVSKLLAVEEGFTVDKNTQAWWDTQSQEARDESFSGTLYTAEALLGLTEYFKGLIQKHPDSEIVVWGNAASFDIKMLEYAYKHLGIPVPWKYYNEMCFRTLKNLMKCVPAPEFIGLKHSALADAIHQSHHAELMLSVLNERGIVWPPRE